MSQEELNKIRNELASKTKEWISNFLYSPAIKFLARNEAKYKAEIEKTRIGGYLKKVPPKDEMISIVLKIFTNEKIAKGYQLQYGEEGLAIINKAVWTEGLNRAGLEAILKKNTITITRGKYYQALELIPEVKSVWGIYITILESNLYFYHSEEIKENADLRLVFPMVLRKLFSIHLPKPEGYELTPVSPPSGDYTIYTAEEDIFNELPRIIAFHGKGEIKYSQKGYPNLASAKKMSKLLKLSEFSTDFEYPQRSLLIAGLLSEKFRIKNISEPPLKVIKSLFLTDFNLFPPAPYLLSHLKGITSLYPHNFIPHTSDTIFKTFRQLPEGEWFTLDNLETFVNSHFLDVIPLNSWILSDKIRAEYNDYTDRESSKYSIKISPENIRQWVSRPYLAGHIALLAAFGLSDIATDDNTPNVFTPYDNLYAFRLTPLGAYVLGSRRDYKAPTLQNARTTLIFNENSPVIRIEGDLTLGDTLLDGYVSRVNENFYQFNPGKFLKDCKSANDVQKKISLFKQTIGQKLPPFWENYLEELVSNSRSISRQPNLRVFKIPEGDKTLQQLIVQDEFLKKLILKAELYHVLVPDTHLPAFTERMKELGYLIGDN